MQSAREPRSDLIGAALSGICMVHCVSTPGLLLVAPAAASVLGGFHPLLLVGVTAVAGWSFVPGFRRHRDWGVVGLASLGLVLLGVAAFGFEESTLETLLSVFGAGSMMLAHLRNRTLSRVASKQAAAN
ncbi:MAG: MerC domain-containing protein [Myxococcales bacterium]|nr:MerC domain-containing protein [Myxococcales bacterium]